MLIKKSCKVILLSLFFSIIPINNVSALEISEDTIPLGIYVENINIGGLTVTNAYNKIEEYINLQKNRLVTVLYNDNKFEFTLDEIGYTYVKNDYIQQAVMIGKKGNLISKYKTIKDVYYNHIYYPLVITLDEKALNNILVERSSFFNIEPINASVQIKSNKLIYTDHIPGQKLNIERTAKTIIQTILNNKNSKKYIIKGYSDNIEPLFPNENVIKCNTKIGSYKTLFKTSIEGRAANLVNGAKLINNTVVYPGEIFSTYEHLGPFAPENGYYEASAFSQGKVIDSIGGGACQVTSTLYNAVLMAELEVIERHPHSMIVSYVDLSRDAAIAENYKDFKFRNNTDAPILIEAYVKGSELIINIWGNETRDKNRTIKFESRIIKDLPPPPDVITYDSSKPSAYKKIIQSARKGYEAELYKIVYENGIEIERTLINKSVYQPSSRYLVIGTGI